MPVTATAIFIQAPRFGYGTVSAANTIIGDVPNNTTLVFLAGANGSALSKISVTLRESSAQGVGRIYASTDGGATRILVDSIGVSSATISTSAASVRYDSTLASETAPYRLPASAALYFGYSLAMTSAGVACYVDGGDY